MKTPTQKDTASEERTEFDRFKDFVKKIITVPKEEIDQKQAEYEHQKKMQKRGMISSKERGNKR